MHSTLLRHQLLELTNCLTRHVRSLYILKGYKNTLILNELMSSKFNSYCCTFNLNKVNQFSTTSMFLKNKSRVKDRSKVHVDVHQLAEVIKLDKMMSEFDEELEKLKEDLIKYASVRSNIGAIENLPIMYEDEEYKLAELVEISRKPNLIVLSVGAFPQIIPSILETLVKSQMNLNPQQEGTTIYVPIPKITKEYRENLAKNAKQYFVKCKTAISDIRNLYVKKLKRAESIPEDLIYNGENYITAVQREYVEKAEELLKTKQKELLGES
ncbi:ribosome-recycling factor, mitochondrial [Osmia bicornis bicornis]|uniref:ribosome-recycling factor, mitochondrial n=1 Tax=Osmia bicornis bicornis TaxID=1437191 RepID=UPI001EAF0E51|nr:ribosome-recycling factor, mitochondrial [Osmia bicornis bicornis]